MKEFVISEVQAETAVLVGLITKTQDDLPRSWTRHIL